MFFESCYIFGVDIPNKKMPLVSKSFRLSGKTYLKLELMGKAGKDVHAWIRGLLDKEIEHVLSTDRDLFCKVQELQNHLDAS